MHPVSIKANNPVNRAEPIPIALASEDAVPLHHVVRLDVVGPMGQVVPVASGTVRVPPGGSLWHLPLALDDMPGLWQVRATDVVSGHAAVATLQVR